jgi:hypothetical protein
VETLAVFEPDAPTTRGWFFTLGAHLSLSKLWSDPEKSGPVASAFDTQRVTFVLTHKRGTADLVPAWFGVVQFQYVF